MEAKVEITLTAAHEILPTIGQNFGLGYNYNSNPD